MPWLGSVRKLEWGDTMLKHVGKHEKAVLLRDDFAYDLIR